MADEHDLAHSEPLNEAVKHLKDAEMRLEHAHADGVKAERDIAIAISEIEHAEHDRDAVEVHVVHVNEVERASFKEKLQATLQAVWEKSYIELKVPRKPKDVFQTAGSAPKSLMGFLNLTLEQAHRDNVIEDYCFGIASETGGA